MKTTSKPIFKAHCSRLSDIMSEPKSKADKDAGKLSKTAITYLNDWVKENYHNRKADVNTDAMSKGTEQEMWGSVILSAYLDKEMTLSRERKSNEWITGQIDYDDKPLIRDTKICETFATMPLLGYELENNYCSQMQGYLMLWGEDYTQGSVDKVLVNSPDWLIQKKLMFLYSDFQRKYGESFISYEDDYNKAAYELFKQHVYDKSVTCCNNGQDMQLHDDDVVLIKDRVRSAIVERDNEYISRIPEQVEKCRKYLKQYGY